MADSNRWSGKSPEDVLTESFHEIRNPIYQMAGFLQVLKTLPDLSDDQAKYFMDQAINCSLSAKEIVSSVYEYINEKWGVQ